MAALPSQTKFDLMLPHAIVLLVMAPVIACSVWISAWQAGARRGADGGYVSLMMADPGSIVESYGGEATQAPTREEELNASLRARVERFNTQVNAIDKAETAAEAYFYSSLLGYDDQAEFWRSTALSLGGDCAGAKQYYTNSSRLRLYTLWNELNIADQQAATEQDAWYFLQGKLGPPVVTIVDEHVEAIPE